MQILECLRQLFFCALKKKFEVKRRKPRQKAKMSMTKRGTVKSPFYEKQWRHLLKCYSCFLLFSNPDFFSATITLSFSVGCECSPVLAVNQIIHDLFTLLIKSAVYF